MDGRVFPLIRCLPENSRLPAPVIRRFSNCASSSRGKRSNRAVSGELRLNLFGTFQGAFSLLLAMKASLHFCPPMSKMTISGLVDPRNWDDWPSFEHFRVPDDARQTGQPYLIPLDSTKDIRKQGQTFAPIVYSRQNLIKRNAQFVMQRP